MFRRSIVCMAAVVLAVGCGRGSAPTPISELREVPSPQVDLSVQGRDRFGMRTVAASQPAAQSSPFDWDTPPGWHAEPPSSLRLVNLAIGDDHSAHAAECYVTILQGDGGGLEANVNRWRAQMGQPPLSDAEIAALPKLSMLNQEATYVSIPGTYTGMQHETHVEDALMLGAIFIAQGRAVFVKFVGKADVVEAERTQFENFCASLRPAGAAPPSVDTTQPPADQASVSSQHREAAFDPASLTWEAPPHWQRGRESSMRLMTYLTGPEQNAECVVSVFPGDVGGLVANVNRWRDQMGLEPADAASIDALPRIEVLGRPSTVVEIDGDYRGMGDTAQPGFALLGIICTLPAETLFFKFTGPAGVIAEEKEHFLAFAQSFMQ